MKLNTNNHKKIRGNGTKTNEIAVSTGSRQGNILSLILFNMILYQIANS